jgi:alkaline phosphatase D
MRIPIYFFLMCFLMACAGSSEEKNTKTDSAKVKVDRYGLDSLMNPALAPFYHGVASGDPLKDAVIIWTRLTPEYHGTYEIDWEMAKDSTFRDVVQQGKTNTDSSRDYTVKIDVRDLQSDTRYYYRFKSEGEISSVGKTKTLPDGKPKNVNLAFASCSNYAWGYFNAYRRMAQDTLDAVVHLGDYIYEHEQNVYASKALARHHLPNKEIISVSDYRTRYALYRLDPDLQAVHAAHPFIVIWDDHEITNNTYATGAQNHQETEGDWSTRLATAKKVYYEWMPIREHDGHHYRSFVFGDLLRLVMLDTRTDGRTIQPDVVNVNDLDSGKHIIHPDQMKWLEKELMAGEKWKVIGNQILFSDMYIFFEPKPMLYTDGWSAYRYDQKRLMDVLAKQDKVVVVTGDFHSAFIWKGKSGKNNYLEFVVPSVTSANYDEDLGIDSAEVYRNYYLKKNSSLNFTDLVQHGYLLLHADSASISGQFVFMESILEKGNTKEKKSIRFGF